MKCFRDMVSQINENLGSLLDGGDNVCNSSPVNLIFVLLLFCFDETCFYFLQALNSAIVSRKVSV